MPIYKNMCKESTRNPYKTLRTSRTNLLYMKFSTLVLGLLLAQFCRAQQKYTDVIQQKADNGGTLVLYQSKTITDLVNGVVPENASTAKKVVKDGKVLVVDSIDNNIETVTTGQRTYVRGYRIQVYSGDNTRKGKAEAAAMAGKVRQNFSDLPVYTHFVSPHWICRVGDFRTYEEANEYFRQLRETGLFPEAVIVRSKVAVYN